MITVLPASDAPHPSHEQIEYESVRSYQERVNAPLSRSDIPALERAWNRSREDVLGVLRFDEERSQ